MTLAKNIETLITPSLLAKGFGVVRVDLQGSQKKTLQIMIEREDEKNISADDCALVSDLVSILLDVEDPIHESYTLEVSSPGLDRPLTKKEDFKRFAGALVKVELKAPYQGMRRFQGILQGIDEERIKFDLSPSPKYENLGIAEVAFSDIQKAKLVPNYEA